MFYIILVMGGIIKCGLKYNMYSYSCVTLNNIVSSLSWLASIFLLSHNILYLVRKVFPRTTAGNHYFPHYLHTT